MIFLLIALNVQSRPKAMWTLLCKQASLQAFIEVVAHHCNEEKALTLKKMTDAIEILYQNKTQHEEVEDFEESTAICSYCADKLLGNKDVAISVFNKLAVVPTPDCIRTLNLFERSLIKFCMTCLTVVRLGQITGKRPQNELTAAMKGRIAYLPVDVEANAKFMPAQSV